jgi:hypothetical protein
MDLQKILAENMLRFKVKNLNDSQILSISRKAGFDIYSDYTYINEHGDLTESTQLKLMLEQTEEPTFADSDSSTLSKQSKLRKVGSKVRRSIQATPLMVKWAQWRQKKWVKRKGLPTRETVENADTDQVRNTPGYKEILDLLYGKRTRDEGSILYWYGAEVLGGEADPQAEQEMKNVINTMKQIDGAEIKGSDADAEPIVLNLTGFISKLEEMAKQKVYLTGYDLIQIFSKDSSNALNWLFTVVATGKDEDGFAYKFGNQQSFMNDIDANYNSNKEGNVDQFYNDMKLDIPRLQNFSTKLIMGAAGEGNEGGNATFALEMEEKDKLAMIPRVMEQHRLNLEEKPNLTWQDYTSFYIAPGESEIKVNLVQFTKTNAKGDEQEAFASYYSYPDNPNDPATQNVIYGNKDDETSWNDTSGFAAEMKRRIDAIVADGGEIYRIEYNAGARSSTVGTTKYGGNDVASKTKGNIQLCTERALGITTAMKPVIDQLLPNLPDGAKVLQKPNLHPNRGPGWYEYDPNGTEDAAGKTYGTGYGPLYNKWYTNLKGYKKFQIPRSFYSARNANAVYDNLKQIYQPLDPKIKAALGPMPTQADIEKEYQTIFGPHRGTYAGYVLFYTMKPDTPPASPSQDIDAKIQTAGAWYFSLDYDVYTWGDFKRVVKSRWKRFKRRIKKFKIPKLSLLPGGGVIENLVEKCDAYG